MRCTMTRRICVPENELVKRVCAGAVPCAVDLFEDLLSVIETSGADDFRQFWYNPVIYLGTPMGFVTETRIKLAFCLKGVSKGW